MIDLLPLLAVGMVGAGFALWHFVYCPAARRRRLLRSTRRVTITAARQGHVVKIAGTLDLGEADPLIAPISGRPCAVWEVKVTERSGNNTRTIIEDNAHLPHFWLTDDTGSALVEIAGQPALLVAVDEVTESGTFNDASPGLEGFLARHGNKSTGWLFNRSLTYKEGVLEAREQVAVLARASWEPDPNPQASHGAAGYRGHAMRLVLRAPPGGAMLLSDDPSTLGD